MKYNTFDIDGVIHMDGDFDGVYPGPQDFIITGRSYEERLETELMLTEKNIKNRLFMNPLPFDKKTRESSGQFKAKKIKELLLQNYDIGIHFEDDPIQADIIRKEVPEINVVLLQHNLVERENVRRTKQEY